MSKGGPDLKRYMDKHLSVKINANRRVTGVLRGYDQFMNMVGRCR
jgi:small nuclear ribonucleoprotein G